MSAGLLGDFRVAIEVIGDNDFELALAVSSRLVLIPEAPVNVLSKSYQKIWNLSISMAILLIPFCTIQNKKQSASRANWSMQPYLLIRARCTVSYIACKASVRNGAPLLELKFVADVDLASSFLHKLRREIRKMRCNKQRYKHKTRK